MSWTRKVFPFLKRIDNLEDIMFRVSSDNKDNKERVLDSVLAYAGLKGLANRNKYQLVELSNKVARLELLVAEIHTKLDNIALENRTTDAIEFP